MAQLRRNVADGRIDLCLAVDRIDRDLRRLIEYLNLATRADVRVTALQLVYAKHAGVEILVPSTFGGELADAKRPGSRPDVWTWATLFEELGTDADRKLAEDIRQRIEALQGRRGDHEPVWFGSKPSGGVFLHPYGVRYAPLQLWMNRARHLIAFGTWNQYGPIAHHEGFASLAKLLGQDIRGPAGGVRVASLPVDELWETILQCAEAINR